MNLFLICFKRWGDLLTAYNGTAITHDGIGNPLNDGTWSYSWDGRQLNSMTDGTTTWSYEYDFDGLRTERSNGSTTYEYVYSGSSLVQMTVGSNILRFAYDGTAPITVTCNGTVYYYVTNLQGDVIAILDSTGTAVVQYTYDAWGNLLGDEPADDTIGHLNPLRYRGYVYDQESGFYYCQSRYYDPGIGRFLNADSYASTGQGLLGYNMFAYCGNNPVNYGDSSGTSSEIVLDPRYIYMDEVNGVGARSARSGSGYELLALSCLIAGLGAVYGEIYASVSYAYRQYTRSIKKSIVGLQPGNYPVTHHIVPYGTYSTRDPYTRQQLAKTQKIMISAGVDPEHDLINQVVISAGYHNSLHTNDYILMVTKPIIALGDNPTKNQIYEVLFYLRIAIAANDPYANGY